MVKTCDNITTLRDEILKPNLICLPRPTSLQPHGRNLMASICKLSSQSGCPLCRACRHFSSLFFASLAESRVHKSINLPFSTC